MSRGGGGYKLINERRSTHQIPGFGEYTGTRRVPPPHRRLWACDLTLDDFHWLSRLETSSTSQHDDVLFIHSRDDLDFVAAPQAEFHRPADDRVVFNNAAKRR